MSGLGGAARSAAVGLVLGLGALAATVLAGRAASWFFRSLQAGLAIGATLRILGALAGVTAGVLLRPASMPWFVAAFLVSYLAGQAVVVLGAGSPGLERRGARGE